MIFLVVFLLVLALAGAVVVGPGMPDRWNPLAPLDPTTQPNFLTRYKLDKAAGNPDACLAVVGNLDDLRFSRLQDRHVSDQCFITGHVEVRRLASARMRSVRTSCGTALRLYMWDRHSLQPAAQRRFGQAVTDLGDLGSYSCRRIRTAGGPGERMSAHATANAIDISAVQLEDGRRLDLEFGWTAADTAERAFWRDLRDGGCKWFRTVLSPDFNQLHADHFHFAQGAFGACR